jgi:pilus assembly protein Flp/PilA
MSIKNRVMSFLREEEGLTMVEYAVAGGVIALGVVAAFTDLATAISTKIADIIGAMG